MVEKPTKRQGAKFTEKMLARAAAGKRPVMIYDARCPGLGAKAGAGKVSFFLRYGGRQKRRFLALGRLSDDLSLGAVRRLAVETLGQVARGKDPVAERAAATAKAMQFSAWAQAYLTRTDRLRKEKAQPRYYLAIAAAKWARRSLASITRSHVLNLRDALGEEGAKVGAKRERDDHQFDGHPRANRWLAHVAACFRAAVDENLIATNPAKGVKQLPENPPRARVLSDDEMERLLEALEGEDEFTAAVFHVLIETGCRVSEVLRARWADLDLVAGTMRIPSSKAGRPQTIPLAGVTVERLEALPKLGEWLFPAGDLAAHRADVKKDWARLKEKERLRGARIPHPNRTL